MVDEKAAYLKEISAEVRDVELREPDRNEVEVALLVVSSVGMIIFWQIMQC